MKVIVKKGKGGRKKGVSYCEGILLIIKRHKFSLLPLMSFSMSFMAQGLLLLMLITLPVPSYSLLYFVQ